MKLGFASFVVVAICQSVVHAAAVAPNARDYLTIFEDTNYTGLSEHYNNPIRCVDVPDDLREDVSSLLVGDNIYCQMYGVDGCSAQYLGTYYGGRTSPGRYPSLGSNNDKAISFQCYHYA